MVFGITVAGRPAEIEGMFEVVGLFINSVPMRVRWTDEASLLHVAEQIQSEFAALAGHQHLSLAEIQQALGRRNLFDTYLSVANQPSFSGFESRNGLRAGPVTISDRTHYPLSISVDLDRRIGIRIDYVQSACSVAGAEDIGRRLARICWKEPRPGRSLRAP